MKVICGFRIRREEIKDKKCIIMIDVIIIIIMVFFWYFFKEFLFELDVLLIDLIINFFFLI